MSPRLPIVAISLLVVLIACSRTPEPATPSPGSAPAQGPAVPTDPAPGVVERTSERPGLQLSTVDGGHYDLAAHRGKWVVVNFWATWCGPCLKEMPELSALHTMRDNIEVVGLAYEDIEPVQMQAFLKQHPVSYPIAILDTYAPPRDFATPRGLPITYLIAPDGRVAKQFLGPVDAHAVEAAITAAVGQSG